ncbi:phosphoribosyl-dephospho-CoA transferase [Comamonas sp. BIGb0124]|uniref:malonate decarboxylase holo-[acyl-carrier-protein] synthase n=1 Tax=Comamonas sp. BIGb0124 TaxID=2485130 RepID=UPI000F46ABF3|nr:malonate decarboxylase holo-[acyl-carrier-protein] synthase [Comamonas sp. BIGb0124]ROR24456.1 phosphoribosyl-dephospho-CoA transferase [Comamonas sp. BIGb0124]
MAVALRRHQLVYLGRPAWSAILSRSWDSSARACLTHWSSHALPLVVTRQTDVPQPGGDDVVALGLPAPLRWDKRRLALQVARRDILWFDEFPRANQVTSLLPASAQPGWRRLCAELETLRLPARAYGSHGWQWLSGLDHVRPQSDIDLWLGVQDAQQADAACRVLTRHTQQAHARMPRLDGELLWSDGTAVAWREWQAWRAGATPAILVKRLAQTGLARRPFWPDAPGETVPDIRLQGAMP